jgi:hypothetical protein
VSLEGPITKSVADALARLDAAQIPPRAALISTGPRECTIHDLFAEHRAWHCKRCQRTGPAAEHPDWCHGVPVAVTVLIVRGWTGG